MKLPPLPVEDIRDIRGPIVIPPWWRWPLAVAVAALLAFAIVLVVRWWRARAKTLTPLEKALAALARAEALAREGRSHEWADVVAETLRGALAARLGTEMLPQTTAELTRGAFMQTPLAADLDSRQVIELLETCDLARFAKARVEAEGLLASTAVARELTHKLFAPAPPAPPAPAPQPHMVTS